MNQRRRQAWWAVGILLGAFALGCGGDVERRPVAKMGPGLKTLPGGTLRLEDEAAAPPAATAAEPQSHTPRAPIYDDKADARAQIATALEIARRDNKRVLVEFGGNWCGWCYKLYDVFHNDPDVAPLVRDEYELVLVDSATNGDLLRSYGADNEKHGLPFLTVLDAGGQVLVNQNTSDLEDGPQHDSAKVKAFLEHWKTERPSAETAWKAALEQARREDKRVLLYASAPWCGWCHRLGDLLAKLDPLLARDYVVQKIDTERMDHGAELIAQHRDDRSQGIPWLAIFESDGRLLITSDGPAGNIGYPAKDAEQAHFLAMLRATKRRLSDDELKTIAATLKTQEQELHAGP